MRALALSAAIFLGALLGCAFQPTVQAQAVTVDPAEPAIYNTLVTSTDSIFGHSGEITASVTSKGVLTGKLLLGKKIYRLTVPLEQGTRCEKISQITHFTP